MVPPTHALPSLCHTTCYICVGTLPSISSRISRSNDMRHWKYHIGDEAKRNRFLILVSKGPTKAGGSVGHTTSNASPFLCSCCTVPSFKGA